MPRTSLEYEHPGVSPDLNTPLVSRSAADSYPPFPQKGN